MPSIYSKWDSLTKVEKKKILDTFDMEFLTAMGSFVQNEMAEEMVSDLHGFSMPPRVIDPKKTQIDALIKYLTMDKMKEHAVSLLTMPIFSNGIDLKPIFLDENGKMDSEIQNLIDENEKNQAKGIQKRKAFEKACITKAVGLLKNPTDFDREFLKYVSRLLLEGRATGQIPSIEITVTNVAMASDAAVVKKEDFFKQGLIGWKTSKGFITTPECKNPKTNRRLSGFLFISKKGLNKYRTALYSIYSDGCDHSGREKHPNKNWYQLVNKSIEV